MVLTVVVNARGAQTARRAGCQLTAQAHFARKDAVSRPVVRTDDETGVRAIRTAAVIVHRVSMMPLVRAVMTAQAGSVLMKYAPRPPALMACRMDRSGMWTALVFVSPVQPVPVASTRWIVSVAFVKMRHASLHVAAMEL